MICVCVMCIQAEASYMAEASLPQTFGCYACGFFYFVGNKTIMKNNH